MSDLINEFGVITRWPKKRLDKEYIIKYLSEKFQPGIEYSEKEINSIIKKHHTFNDIPLLENYVITIEPGIYLAGWGGVRIEDDCWIQKDGCVPLNKSTKDLLILN